MMNINTKTTLFFDEAFSNGEIRCGAIVSTKLKQVWAIELDLLKQVDTICQKHNIKYCAYTGTLLRAIRHDGFIPCDDGLDIYVARENYEKFIQIVSVELAEPYFL